MLEGTDFGLIYLYKFDKSNYYLRTSFHSKIK